MWIPMKIPHLIDNNVLAGQCFTQRNKTRIWLILKNIEYFLRELSCQLKYSLSVPGCHLTQRPSRPLERGGVRTNKYRFDVKIFGLKSRQILWTTCSKPEIKNGGGRATIPGGWLDEKSESDWCSWLVDPLLYQTLAQVIVFVFVFI